MAGHERMIAASSDLVERGPGVRFEIERDGRRVPAFVVRAGGAARAYLNVCAHEGTELDWAPGEFFDPDSGELVCATHGARYDPRDGRCVGGPCRGASLVALPVVERDGGVLLIE